MESVWFVNIHPVIIKSLHSTCAHKCNIAFEVPNSCTTCYYHILSTAIDSDKGEALLVLCEEELLAFDLQTAK